MRAPLLALLLVLVHGAASAQSGSPSPSPKSLRAAPKQAPAATSKPGGTETRDKVKDLNAKHLAYCMRDWDAATHMTKGEWERTCRRVVKDRFQFRLDNVDK